MTIPQLEQPLHRNEWPWPNPNIKEIDAEVLRLRAALAGKDVEVFERRSVDRAEPVGAVHAASGVDELLARDHGLRQVVAKAFERSRSDSLLLAHSAASSRVA